MEDEVVAACFSPFSFQFLFVFVLVLFFHCLLLIRVHHRNQLVEIIYAFVLY